MSRFRSIVLFPISVITLCLSAQAAAQPERNTLVPEGHVHYVPSIFPDRIVLLIDAQPHNSQTVTWRTDAGVSTSLAQITVARDTPGLHLSAETVSGNSTGLDAGNGAARHHRVTFSGLQPDTLYAYRVAGGSTWSEWFQFRTAKAEFSPFSFLYFGDAQNSVKSHFSRVIREAWREAPMASVMLHAGDLVNQRDNSKHDDEWAEWFDAGSFLHASVPAIVVAGNHEHIDIEDESGNEYYELGPLWKAHFDVPQNGLAELGHTTYYSLYQGVLFVVLDSTMALESDSVAQQQAQWLDRVLTENPARWVIVSHHHPVYSVSLDRDNPPLREHWQPVFQRHDVDLVLQGHDHVYGRGTNLAQGTTVVQDDAGPVYVVSVAGPKMYLVSDNARATLERTGEDVQLYQIIHLEEDELRFESRTVTGELYDAFSIQRQADGSKRVLESSQALPAEHLCMNPDRPRPTRCWNGVELVEPVQVR